VRKTFSKPIDSDLDDDGAEPDSPENWSDREETPSKRAKTGAAPGQKHGTPTRRAATKATVTIADASAQLLSGDSHSEAETPSSSAPLGRSVGSATPATAPVPAHQSIFGHIEVKPDRRLIDAAFSRNGTDPYIGGDGLADDLIYGVNLPLDEDFYDEAEV
jgi:hypothetical protein